MKVFKVIKIDNTHNFKFIEYGKIKHGYIYTNYEILLNTIAFILNIIPDYSPDYNYNIVENLRTEFHRITKKFKISYGIIYWKLFFLTTVICIVNELNYKFSIFSFLLIFIMVIFSIIVNTKVLFVPKLKRSKKL